MPTNTDTKVEYLEFQLLFTDHTSRTGGIELFDLQLELGSVATEFEHLPIGITQQLCNRYYFRIDTGENLQMFPITNSDSGARRLQYQFPTQMRIPPAITVSGNNSAEYGPVTAVQIHTLGCKFTVGRNPIDGSTTALIDSIICDAEF